MENFSRRDFLKYASSIAALLGVGPAGLPRVVQALEKLTRGDLPVLWLQGQSCSGCSVSFLNTINPGPLEVLTQYISLKFHSTLSTATGHQCSEIIEAVSKKGNFALVIEGSIPAGMPEACVMNHRPFGDVVAETAKAAKAVLAVGTCAAFGGIPAAENNLTGALSAPDFLKKKGVATPCLSLSGCPIHPDWLVGTIVQIIEFGLPAVDKLGRPEIFYGRTVHDYCPRFADYERQRFAEFFSDSGCMFKLGCLGPLTAADCTVRHWNSGANTCIKAGAPCIGCAAPEFCQKTDLPFYRLGESAAGSDKEDSK